ncbi:MAG: hypothetical protein CFE28_06370 [Alphaproteobacteria bacterium PA2]|nr:MAG: hypothetical protein CFE28_06370 [Alphaproteobacteria bacterium PA2]
MISPLARMIWPLLDVPGVDTRLLGPADAEALDGLHFACAEFVELIEGRPPASGDGQRLLSDRPEGCSPEDKLVFGLFHSGRLVGAIDLLRNYPEPRRWYLGLLMLAPDVRDRGLGTRTVTVLGDWIHQQNAQSIRLIVQDDNPLAQQFWLRQGFAIVGSTVHHSAAKESCVFQLECNLATL